eukprot:4874076-Prymnesium_polylepis.1
MGWLQCLTLRLPNVGCERLRLVRPRHRVEVDDHVVVRGQIAPRLNVGNLKQPRPCGVQLVSALSRPHPGCAGFSPNGRV